MVEPPLVDFDTEDEYREYFHAAYCRAPIVTFDGIPVRFRKSDFDHCCFRRSDRRGEKDTFCPVRARRTDWIGVVLRDPNADLYFGWDRKRKCVDYDCRVAVAFGRYVLAVRLDKTRTKAFFITAYLADNKQSVDKVRSCPKWQAQKKDR
jgi:hypothetical protein